MNLHVPGVITCNLIYQTIMKNIYYLIIFIIFNNYIFSQNVTVTKSGNVGIVNVGSGSALNMIVPSNISGEGSSGKNTENIQPDNSTVFIWQLKFTASNKVFKDISFANTQVGYIVTELGSVYKTTNGGDNWVSVMNLGFPYYWYGVHALSIDTIVIAGFNNSDSIRRGAMRWSFNGGSTWTPDVVLQRPTNGVGWLDRVHFYNQNTGIVFNGLSGACYYTTTGGKTAGAWNFVQINTDLGWFAGNYDFQPGGNIYAAGIHIGKSTDLGVSWVSGPTADNVFDGGIDFLDQNNLFGWTGGGSISPSVAGWTHHTTDGGNNWGVRQMTFAFPIRAVKFFDQNTGFAIGGNLYSEAGGIFSTSNGGVNWNQDISTAAEMFALDYKILSADSMDVWCVGSTGGGTGYTGKLYKGRFQNLVGIAPVGNSIPGGFKLFQNYPNPFNPVTVINYQLALNSFVKFSVFDISGKLVETLVNKTQSAGEHKVDFDGSNLSSGIYFYKLEAGVYNEVRKMILLK